MFVWTATRPGRSVTIVAGASRVNLELSDGYIDICETRRRRLLTDNQKRRKLSHPGATIRRVRTSSDMADYEARLRVKLDRTSVHRNLALAGAVMTVHECLKSVIVDHLREFFIFPGEAETRYRKEVLGLGGSTFEASCRWLTLGGVLTEGDRRLLSQFQQHRHAVAHELLTFVADPDSDIDWAMLRAAADLLHRIGLFWARIGIDCDEEFDGLHIPDDEITPGLSVFVDLLLSTVADR